MSATYMSCSGWLRAVDEELVCTHLGVADADDTYEVAKHKLQSLIDWHVQVAIDPVVNGGYLLVPINPTPEMLSFMSTEDKPYCNEMFSNAFNVEDFKRHYKELMDFLNGCRIN